VQIRVTDDDSPIRTSWDRCRYLLIHISLGIKPLKRTKLSQAAGSECCTTTLALVTSYSATPYLEFRLWTDYLLNTARDNGLEELHCAILRCFSLVFLFALACSTCTCRFFVGRTSARSSPVSLPLCELRMFSRRIFSRHINPSLPVTHYGRRWP